MRSDYEVLMIFDLILAVIFIVLIAVNIHRGAAKSIANILAIVISYIASTALGKIIAAAVYDGMVRPALNQAVSNALSNVSTDAANTVVNSLPTWLTGLLNVSGDDLSNLLAEPISNVNGTITNAVDAAVKPVAIGLLTFFITIILFFLFLIVLRFLLVRPLARVFRFPVLNAINRILGAVIGIVDAILLVSMLAYLTKLILVNIGSNSTWFNESTIYNSFIFYHFYSGNIFTWVSSLVTG